MTSRGWDPPDWISILRRGIERGRPLSGAPQVALVVKNPPVNTEDTREATSLISGSGRSPAGGDSHPLQYSCLENPMDREAIVHGVAKSWR